MVLKKISAFIISALLLSGVASAQGLRIEGGLSASGVNFSNGGKDFKRDLKTGYRVGAAYEFKFLPVVYLSAGVNLKGESDSFDLLGTLGQNLGLITEVASGSTDQIVSGLTNLTLSSTSLTIPVNIGLRFKPVGIFGFSIEAGPYLSYELNSKFKSNNILGSLSNIAVESIDGFKSKKFGYGVGGSIGLEITRFYLRAGAEYGLSNRFDIGDNLSLGALADEFKEALKDVNLKNLSNNLKGADSRPLHIYLTAGFRF